MTALIRGFGYLLKGTHLLAQPKIRRYVVIPLLINIVLFLAGIWLLIDQLGPYVDGWVAALPSWLSWLEGGIWLILTLTVSLTLFIVVSFGAVIVASPFNSLLAEAVLRTYGVAGEQPSLSTTSLLASIPHLLLEELRKVAYFAIRAIPLLLLFLIPVVNIAAPFLWFLFSAWMMAITYLAYPFEVKQIPFNQSRIELKKHRWSGFGFGCAVLLATMIPGLNLIVMPAAVAGATLLYLRELS